MKIKDLYTDESRWTKGAYARNGDGHAVLFSEHDNAYCFCLVGAIYKCYPDQINEIRKRIGTHLGIELVYEWNDNPSRTFAEVKSLVEVLDI